MPTPVDRAVRILHLEACPGDVEQVKDLLDREGLLADLTWVNDRDGFLSALADGRSFDLVLADCALPGIGGEEALEIARNRAPDLPFLFLSRSLGEERAAACLRRGAADCVPKDDPARLAPAVRRALAGGRAPAAAGPRGFTEAALAARVVPWILTGDRLAIPEAAEAILGLSPLPGDLEGLVAILHPEDADLFLEALERSRNVSFRARIRRSGGDWGWTRWNVDRGPEGYRGVIMDITEEAWRDGRMHQRRRMDGARELARRLAARLQGPLGGCVDELRTLAALPGQERRLREALLSLDEAGRLLAQLRAFAHLGRPARVATPPNAFVVSLLARAREAAGPGIRIDFEPGGDLPEAPLDPAALEQALGALLANARQALGGSGAIRVATGILPPRPYRPGGTPGPMRTRIYIEVRDAGPGIPPAIRGKVFDPFFTTRLERGSAGLGLAMAWEILEGHGGSVQLESAPGKGTAVRLILPV
ncbi:hybrid sensor histidine kinase/response regulator [Geothrix sp. 21YS21S-2]|uniref:hybrid sensor histidine kinase/response regulator n=1 Tax=Geothrix sp. 21YS21S-2 TaxID=3068893 RepID=UPI0027B8A254|nr:hybrid sensor histidine kinase/response regulator [Geothrix sp. 21YS21S-2]